MYQFRTSNFLGKSCWLEQCCKANQCWGSNDDCCNRNRLMVWPTSLQDSLLVRYRRVNDDQGHCGPFLYTNRIALPDWTAAQDFLVLLGWQRFFQSSEDETKRMFYKDRAVQECRHKGLPPVLYKNCKHSSSHSQLQKEKVVSRFVDSHIVPDGLYRLKIKRK